MTIEENNMQIIVVSGVSLQHNGKNVALTYASDCQIIFSGHTFAYDGTYGQSHLNV